jgi:hypothetical protein
MDLQPARWWRNAGSHLHNTATKQPTRGKQYSLIGSESALMAALAYC